MQLPASPVRLHPLLTAGPVQVGSEPGSAAQWDRLPYPVSHHRVEGAGWKPAFGCEVISRTLWGCQHWDLVCDVWSRPVLCRFAVSRCGLMQMWGMQQLLGSMLEKALGLADQVTVGGWRMPLGVVGYEVGHSSMADT